MHGASGRNRRRKTPAAPDTRTVHALTRIRRRSARPPRRYRCLASPATSEQTHRLRWSRLRGERARSRLVRLFLADIQTGFGPFIAIYLTARLVAGRYRSHSDRRRAGRRWPLRCRRRAGRCHALGAADGALAVIAIGLSALALALWPVFAMCWRARPACGRKLRARAGDRCDQPRSRRPCRLGARLGRNARFASIGNGVAAAAMGAIGQFVSNQAVFFLTAALAAPALLALAQHPHAATSTVRGTRGNDRKARDHRSGATSAQPPAVHLCRLHPAVPARQRRDAAAHGRHLRAPGEWASTLIAACMVVPQLWSRCLRPGSDARPIWGRRPLLLLALPRWRPAACCSAGRDPYLIVAVQVLDGVSGAILGVMFPLDRRRHHARHRTIQSRARHRRQRGGHRRGAEHHARPAT